MNESKSRVDSELIETKNKRKRKRKRKEKGSFNWLLNLGTFISEKGRKYIMEGVSASLQLRILC